MPPDPLILKSIPICQFTRLGTISCGKNYCVSLFRHFINDRLKKRNMGGVIQINPYRLIFQSFFHISFRGAINLLKGYVKII